MEFVRMLSIRDAAKILGKSEDWLRGQLRRGFGPPARKVSPRCLVIREDDLRAWADRLACVNQAPDQPLFRTLLTRPDRETHQVGVD